MRARPLCVVCADAQKFKEHFEGAMKTNKELIGDGAAAASPEKKEEKKEEKPAEEKPVTEEKKEEKPVEVS